MEIECGWNEWQGTLFTAYERGFSAIMGKGGQAATARKAFTSLFLQAKGFNTPAANVLTKAISLMRESTINDACYDALAMLGHRIGMLENAADLKQYLRDIHEPLKPEGKILLTSMAVNPANIPGLKLPGVIQIQPAQFQNENLIGPFFSMLRVKADGLKNLAVTTGWNYEAIYRQDDENFTALLSISSKGQLTG
jgi:hypothetical protein